MKKFIWWHLSIFRDNSFLPEFIVDLIDDIRHSDYFEEYWYE